MNGSYIVVVDDNPANCRLFQDQLFLDNYRVAVAVTGHEAMQLIRASPPPDLVLLDVALPDISGFEVCERLKRDPATAKIPIIMISAIFIEPGDAREGIESGADSYLTQPVGSSRLRAEVAAALQLGKIRERIKASHGGTTSEAGEILQDIANLEPRTAMEFQRMYSLTKYLIANLSDDSEIKLLAQETLLDFERFVEHTLSISVRARKHVKS